LVALKWYEAWESFTSGKGPRPESIDNSPLLDDATGKLKRGLLDMQDYMLLHKEVFLKLVEWYGGGPLIERPVIEIGLKRRAVVEVYPMTIRVSERRNTSREEAVVEASKGAMGLELLRLVCQQLYLPPRKCLLWKLGHDGYEQLALNAALGKSGVDEGACLIVEEALPDGAFEQSPPPWQRPKGQADFSTLLQSRSERLGGFVARAVDSDQRAPEVGVTGLVNLGNTCFMNSSLQCVAACAPLRTLLLSDRMEGLINRSNPLGMGGRVAKAMADLLKRMWAEDNLRFVVPRTVKEVISDFAPQFEGYRQHDSQEFLAFLLDGLHEDLNQVKQKQMVAVENAFGLPDAVAASQAWDRHLLRNRSEIVELFHGQMRSKLVCPTCSHVSVTFDPFSFLSLPLPRSDSRQMQVTFVPMKLLSHPGLVEQISVSVSRAATVANLCEAVSSRTGVRADLLVVAEVYQRSVYKEHGPAGEVASIGPTDDVFVFEVERCNDGKPGKQSKEGQTVWKVGTCVTFSLVFRKQPELALVGTPLVFSMAAEGLTAEAIRQKVCRRTRLFFFCFTSKKKKKIRLILLFGCTFRKALQLRAFASRPRAGRVVLFAEMRCARVVTLRTKCWTRRPR
jgi:hypothetical protein